MSFPQVNNAGSVTRGNIETCTVQDMDFMFNVHVRSVFTIIKRAMPHLKKSKGKQSQIFSIFKMLRDMTGEILYYTTIVNGQILEFM